MSYLLLILLSFFIQTQTIESKEKTYVFEDENVLKVLQIERIDEENIKFKLNVINKALNISSLINGTAKYSHVEMEDDIPNAIFWVDKYVSHIGDISTSILIESEEKRKAKIFIYPKEKDSEITPFSTRKGYLKEISSDTFKSKIIPLIKKHENFHETDNSNTYIFKNDTLIQKIKINFLSESKINFELK